MFNKEERKDITEKNKDDTNLDQELLFLFFF